MHTHLACDYPYSTYISLLSDGDCSLSPTPPPISPLTPTDETLVELM